MSRNPSMAIVTVFQFRFSRFSRTSSDTELVNSVVQRLTCSREVLMLAYKSN